MTIRTKYDGCYQLFTDHWGTRLRPTYDPEGIEITEEELYGFELNPDFARIPNTLFNKILSFFNCFEIEAQVVLIRKKDDLTCWDALVPRQVNTPVAVDADKKYLISLTTGIEVHSIPDGWFESGTSHEHPYMTAFWSSDDDTSELKNTGVHCTFAWNHDKTIFTICASVCINGKRFPYDPSVLIDGEFKHKKGHEYIIVNPVFEKVSDVVKSYVTQKVYAPKVTGKKVTGWWKKAQFTDSFTTDFYTQSKLRSFDKQKQQQQVLDVIRDYLLDGGDPKVLHETIDQTETEIYSWGMF
jgi:regulator of RNase E activity RraB